MGHKIWNLKHTSIAWVLLLVALAGLTACQSAAPTPADTVTSTPADTATPFPALPPPTYTATLSPTATLTARLALSSGVALVRGPYLQSVTADSIIIVWETDSPGPGEIVYGETEEYGSSAADPAVDARHVITLTNLAPYTVYHYRVESGGAPLSEELTFRTAAGPDQTEFTFVAFGDTRTQHQIHQEVVDSIVALEPDLVLHTGDLVANGRIASLWETFFEVERELMARVPLFPALGNHEANHQHYFDLFYLPGNERWYAFDYGNARFICLQVDGFADFDSQSEQYAWLEETLAANTQPWLFVNFHLPPYSSSRDVSEQSVRQALTPLFEQYGVDVVFTGHHHNYERNEANGVTYIVTGGGGAPLCVMEDREPTRAAFAVAYHFVWLEVDGGRLEATVFSSKGKVLDEFERTHH